MLHRLGRSEARLPDRVGRRRLCGSHLRGGLTASGLPGRRFLGLGRGAGRKPELRARQEQVELPNPSMKRVLGKGKFWSIAAARFLTEPAWQTFSFWIPLYMVSTRGMDIKQFALFAWLPFLAGDIGFSRGEPTSLAVPYARRSDA